MAIPDDALETFPPLPYAEVHKLVCDGDILLCQGRDVFSKLIRWSTKSPWSHIAIAFRIDTLDEVLVIEAVERIGVRAVSLSDFVSRNSAGVSPYPGKIFLTRHTELSSDSSDPGLRALARFSFNHLGCKFAGGEMIKIAARIAEARLFGSHHTPRMLIPENEFICSEFVAKAFQEAKLKVPWDGLGFIAPSDFANDPKLKPIAQVDVSKPPQPPQPRKKS